MQMKEDVTYNPGHSEQRTLADIRTRVTAMNAPAKTLEHFKKLLSLLTRVLTEVGRW